MKRLIVAMVLLTIAISMVKNGLVGAVGEVMTEDGSTNIVPELYIKAVNPGYTVDGKSNTGEMIEIARRDSGNRILLAGIAVRYTNTSGNTSTIIEFPEHSYLSGESILLRLANSPNSELANLNYAKTLAMKGGLELTRDGKTIDAVCWTGKNDCYKDFISSKPTSLVRNVETGRFEHMNEYEPVYQADWYELEMQKEEEGYGAIPSRCRDLRFSELLSYYETNKSEQFIELYNSGVEQILLDGCQIRYKNKNYSLKGLMKPDEYYAYYPIDFSLTKNPVNGNTLELIDTDGAKVDSLTYPNGQRKGTSYAWIGFNEKGETLWKTTYAPTPGAANNYQEYKTCEAGKVLNEVTGNCVKTTTVSNKTCKEGYYLNILTGRCNKIVTNEEKKCKDGYYLNPETGRCRKITENNGADYSVEPEKYEESSSFVALYVVLGVVGVGLIYLVYEFRREIGKLWHKVWRRFH